MRARPFTSTRADEFRLHLESLLARRERLAVSMAELDREIELARVDLVVATQRELEVPLPQPADNGRQLLRATEVAEMLQVSKTAVYELHKRGRLPAVRPTGERGALRFRVEDVQRYARNPDAFVAPTPIFRRRRVRVRGREEGAAQRSNRVKDTMGVAAEQGRAGN